MLFETGKLTTFVSDEKVSDKIANMTLKQIKDQKDYNLFGPVALRKLKYDKKIVYEFYQVETGENICDVTLYTKYSLFKYILGKYGRLNLTTFISIICNKIL